MGYPVTLKQIRTELASRCHSSADIASAELQFREEKIQAKAMPTRGTLSNQTNGHHALAFSHNMLSTTRPLFGLGSNERWKSFGHHALVAVFHLYTRLREIKRCLFRKSD